MLTKRFHATNPLVDQLWRVIGNCLNAFTPAECANYFTAGALRLTGMTAPMVLDGPMTART